MAASVLQHHQTQSQRTSKASRVKNHSVNALTCTAHCDRVATALEMISQTLARLANTGSTASEPDHETDTAESSTTTTTTSLPPAEAVAAQQEQDSHQLHQILSRLEQAKQALIFVESQPADKHTKPPLDLADALLDAELLAAWSRSCNRYDYSKALCTLIIKLRAEEIAERTFLRSQPRRV